MSKLRINQRNKDNFGNDDEKKEVFSQTSVPITLEKNIEYFLDKSIHEFTKEDLEKFQLTSETYHKTFFESSQKIAKKLFLLAKITTSQSVSLPKEKTQVKANTIVYKLPEIFSELQSLINEIVEDDTTDSNTFLNLLINGLTQLDLKITNKEPMLENIYNVLSSMLQKLESYNIFQQKYIYRSIANCINKKYTNYHLISPEDGSFVDPKFHRVTSGNGQRIVRGLSFILTDKNNDEVLKFGNIKTI